MPGKTTQIKGLTVEWVGHSTVGIYGKKIVYIDPFSEVLKGNEKVADIIVSTHGHRDHFDVNGINKLSREDTYLICRPGSEKTSLKSKTVKELEINEKTTVKEVEMKAVPAYNVKRFRSPGVPFHPEGFGMGVIMVVEGVKIYYAGDTDFIPPMEGFKDEKIDLAFLPIGGTYTMDVDEAIQAVLAIAPKVVIPIHYNHLKGTEADPITFKKKVEEKGETKVIIL